MGRLSTGREKEDTTTSQKRNFQIAYFPNCLHVSPLLSLKKVREGLRAVE